MLLHGLRGTTMEAIAREARIAKPTLYAHFPDKETIFVEIVSALMEQLERAHASGLEGTGDIAERVGNALAGQYTVLAESLAGSPHAPELINERKRMSARFRDTDEHAEAEIAAALEAAGVSDSAALTRIICAAAYGIALKVTDRQAMVGGIRLLCRRLIDPAVGA